MQLGLPVFDATVIDDTVELVNAFFDSGFADQRKDANAINKAMSKKVEAGLVDDVRMFFPVRKLPFAPDRRAPGFSASDLMTNVFSFTAWDPKHEPSVAATIPSGRHGEVSCLYENWHQLSHFPVAFRLKKLTGRSFSVTYFIEHYSRMFGGRWDCTKEPDKRSVLHLVFRQSGSLFNLDTKESFVEYSARVPSLIGGAPSEVRRIKTRIGIQSSFDHCFISHKIMLETLNPNMLGFLLPGKIPLYLHALCATYSRALMRFVSSMSISLRKNFQHILESKIAVSNTSSHTLVVLRAMKNATTDLEDQGFEYFYSNCGILRDLFPDRDCLRTYFEFDIFDSTKSTTANVLFGKLYFSMTHWWRDVSFAELMNESCLKLVTPTLMNFRSTVINSFSQGPWSTRKTFEFIRDHLIPDPISNVNRTYLLDGWLVPAAFYLSFNANLMVDYNNVRSFSSVIYVVSAMNAFYRLYHQLFSDSLQNVEAMFPASHVLNIMMSYCRRHCAISEGEDFMSHSPWQDRVNHYSAATSPIATMMSMLVVLQKYASIEKQRRFFMEIFPPLPVHHEHVVANVDKEVAQYVIQHAYSSHHPETIKPLLPATQIMTDTVSMQNQYAAFIKEGKATGNEVAWRKCRTVRELHDEVSIALNAIKYPNYVRKNTIYEPLQGMKITLPDGSIVTCVAPQDTQMVRDWGTRQHHCIGSYAAQVNDMSKILLGIMKDDGTWLGHMQLSATNVKAEELPKNGQPATDNSWQQNPDKPKYESGRAFGWRCHQFYGERNSRIPDEIRTPILIAIFDTLHDAERDKVTAAKAKAEAAKQEQTDKQESLVGTELVSA